MLIAHLSAECFPVAKVGGLADVVGSLPKYLNYTKGVESIVVMPFVNSTYVIEHELTNVKDFKMPFGGKEIFVNILSAKNKSFPIYLVQIEGFESRDKIYGYSNDIEYFIAFQTAALLWLQNHHRLPDIIHCHDHHTGFVPFMIKYAHMYHDLRHIPTVFTIHNAEYQGIMDLNMARLLPWFDTWNITMLIWNNQINAIASAIKCAYAVTTVSPQYMKELIESESAIAPLLKHEQSKTIGILNGIDSDEWNPDADERLYSNYNTSNADIGKEKNKLKLCDEFGFDPALPLLSFIGRFVYQKGVDVLSEAICRAIIDLELPMNFLIVGSGDQNMALGLEHMKSKANNQFNTFIGYNEDLARNVYAASDFLVMPSRFEPCGLNQFYSLRYGTVPVVRTVGGLLDSITDINDDQGNGIRFIQLTTDDLIHSFYRALELYNNKKRFTELREFIMKQDFSWNISAKKYYQLYEKLL